MNLVFIVLLFLLFFSNINESFKNINYTINFNTTNQARNLFDNYDGIHHYQPTEIKYRSKNKAKTINEMREEYKKNVMDFSNSEKETVKNNIDKLFKKYSKLFPLINEWNLIKMNNNSDFGLPYTINNTIILPEKVLSNIDLFDTLFHEQFHILQFKNQNKFHNFYTHVWKFSPISLPNDKWIKNQFVTNPDGYRKFYRYGSLLPLLIIQNGNTVGVGIKIDKEGNIEKKDGKIMKKELINIKKYYEKFYKINQNYHPHEIFANLMVKIANKDEKMTKNLLSFLNTL